ncbi:hypothetical protein PF005_g24087 [Phytophthora fragariae]|uniref:Uncharacterized protein n=1 Tax=Phytophthora fragariae TaxID=53985 RepID=A0A6A3W3R3_9STRA|nr:hypothetical protein PF003_g18258 [Phytophthora fragariae]KAE8940010.1 hypothetical protein PF009_g10162 [Phytophthora fragariae]KAE9114514.1 hypothetical protein PF007_g10347 [Phytophthora fragariae]KAE9114871.1 hypothetical protein PF010_g9558 [Phytophthora fragariae]KAE9143606.1 hypothetical protein PF006_g11389 [Phytophthora fragariae]
MNGTQEAPAGAPLAAHFEAKRRILTTVKQMEERGEKLEEATPEEILEAASKAAETVFKFDFSISDSAEADAKKRSRNRKRSKKRRPKKTVEQVSDNEAAEKSEDAASGRPTDVAPAAKPAPGKQKKQQGTTPKSTNDKPASSFLKLRKATGTESEVTKMQLRYGHGRRNLAATRQRELRKKAADDGSTATASDDFKFNFATKT